MESQETFIHCKTNLTEIDRSPDSGASFLSFTNVNKVVYRGFHNDIHYQYSQLDLLILLHTLFQHTRSEI